MPLQVWFISYRQKDTSICCACLSIKKCFLIIKKVSFQVYWWSWSDTNNDSAKRWQQDNKNDNNIDSKFNGIMGWIHYYSTFDMLWLVLKIKVLEAMPHWDGIGGHLRFKWMPQESKGGGPLMLKLHISKLLRHIKGGVSKMTKYKTHQGSASKFMG